MISRKYLCYLGAVAIAVAAILSALAVVSALASHLAVRLYQWVLE